MAERQGVAAQLDADIWVLDTLWQDEPGVIASYLLDGPDGVALVDVGSGATVEQLLASIRASGHQPEEIRHLVITHVHLDHAGATGGLLPYMPQARVYVHSIGAPHLIDPSKLIKSASRIYGDAMERLWGTMVPVPADRVTSLEDGDELRVGSRTLRALYTPGHAVHHVAYHDEANGLIFSGDVAGVRLEGVRYVRPPTPPPDLDLDLWAASIDRLAALQPRRLCLPHYGPVDDAQPHLDALKARLYAWGELLLPDIRAGKSDAELADDLARAYDPDVAQAIAAEPGPAGETPSQRAERQAQMVRRYEVVANYLMSAQGYVRYYTRLRPERLAQ